MVINIDCYICPMCNRIHPQNNMSWHHLFPKLGKLEKDEPRIYICRTCHDVIHYCYKNKELREQYNTLEKIIYNSEKINLFLNLYKNKKNNKIYKIKQLNHKIKRNNICQKNIKTG